MLTLDTIAKHIDATIHGDGACQISAFNTLQDAQAGELSFLDNSKYRRYLTSTKASAVILREEDLPQCPASALVVKEPYVAYAKAAQLFVQPPSHLPGIHPSAQIADDAEIDPSATIAANVVIDSGVRIAGKVYVGANCFIGANACIGEQTEIHPNVTIYHDVVIGQACQIYSGAVIGADGFGLANEQGRWIPVPQVGSVILENDVSVGANTTIDRGSIGNTIIRTGVKLDNQIQIAHNVEIGEHTAIAACTGISGSSKIGKHCIIAGGVGIAGHLTITDKVVITAMSGVSNSITEPGMYSASIPAQPNRQWRRNTVTLRNIDKLVDKVSAVEKRLASLTNDNHQ